MLDSKDKLFGFVRAYRNSYETNKVETWSLNYNQHDKLKIDFLYFNDTFEGGNYDNQGNLVPFRNINRDKVLLEYRSTDIDTKDLQISTDDPDFTTQAMLFSKENQNWLKESEASEWLNEMCFSRVQYGGALLKKSVEEGELKINVLKWNDVITDQEDIVNGVVVIKHVMTPEQLMEMSEWDNKEEAIRTAVANREGSEEGDKDHQTMQVYITVHEIHGVFPKRVIDEKADEFEYERQIHIIAGADDVKVDSKGETNEQGVILFSEFLDENPFKLLVRNKQYGRALGRSVIEDLYHPQVFTNDAVYNERLSMNLAGKPLFQQPSGNGIDENLTDDMSFGDILTYKREPITPINTLAPGLQMFDNVRAGWEENARVLGNANEAVTGEKVPSGTAFRTVAILNREGNNLFLQYIEEIGNFISEVYDDWVLPYLEKKLQSPHTLTAEYSLDELRFIDEKIFEFNVEQKVIESIRSDEVFNEEEFREEIQAMMERRQNKRSLHIPRGFYKGFDKKLNVDVSNERIQKTIQLEVLSEMLTTLSQNPDIVVNPVTSRIFFKLVEETKVLSASEIQQLQATISQQGLQAQQAQQAQGSPTEFKSIKTDEAPVPEAANVGTGAGTPVEQPTF